MFWRLDLASCWQLTSVAKNACFAQWGQFLNLFQFFPRTFCDCSLSFLSETSQTHRVTHFQLHCCFISSQNHQEKVWVLFSSSHILCLVNVFSCHLSRYCIQNILLFVCWVWLVEFVVAFIRFHIVGHIVLFFVLCFGCCWFSNSFDKWVWFFLWLTPFICVCVKVCLRYWITYLRLLCFYVDITCVCLRLESISLKHFIFWMLCLTAMCFILGVCGFHWSFILMFYACSYLMWSYLCYQSLMFECSQSVHIMVMVDCLIDSYF